jgi:hypothetical protein
MHAPTDVLVERRREDGSMETEPERGYCLWCQARKSKISMCVFCGESFCSAACYQNFHSYQRSVDTDSQGPTPRPHQIEATVSTGARRGPAGESEVVRKLRIDLTSPVVKRQRSEPDK